LLGTVPIAPWEFAVAVAEDLVLLFAAEMYKIVPWHLRHGEKSVAA
jgi:hypothetical protein